MSISAVPQALSDTAPLLGQTVGAETQTPGEAPRPGLVEGTTRVQNIGLSTLAVVGAAALLIYEPIPFSIGLLFSIVKPTTIRDAIDRISTIWNRQIPLSRAVIVGLSILTWPVSLTITAFFVGGRVGLSFQ